MQFFPARNVSIVFCCMRTMLMCGCCLTEIRFECFVCTGSKGDSKEVVPVDVPVTQAPRRSDSTSSLSSRAHSLTGSAKCTHVEVARCDMIWLRVDTLVLVCVCMCPAAPDVDSDFEREVVSDTDEREEKQVLHFFVAMITPICV